MTARDAFLAARAAGVNLSTDGETLFMRARAAPPAEVVEGLQRWKAEIIAGLVAPARLDDAGLPFRPCPRCGGRDFYRPSIVAAGERFAPRGWCCYRCAPPPRGLVIDACSLPPAAPGFRIVEAATPAPRRPAPAYASTHKEPA